MTCVRSNPLNGRKAKNYKPLRRAAALFTGAAIALVAVASISGCGTAAGAGSASHPSLAITPGISSLDTNCTGCNAVNPQGNAVERFTALLPGGAPAAVAWSVAGGDAKAGPGVIDAEGRYTPPAFLTADSTNVLVTARLVADPATVATARIGLTAGFLQPLTPENAALGADGTLSLTGKLAQAGGRAEIHFALSNSANGQGTGLGSLGPAICERSPGAFTACTVTYTAPAAIPSTGVVYVVATVGSPVNSRTDAEILLNTASVSSNPIAHQDLQPTLMPLGSSGGNNTDYDARGNTIADCCSGTLGALVEDNAGRQFILSNNHVLARSDHATVGDSIVQPGLIDNNCTPNGDGPGTVPVAALSTWLPLRSPQTNADAAIAQVASRTIDAAGSILELGSRQPDGTLASAPPGISSTAGRGETATLDLRVAKSGRTTGLTCGAVSTVFLDVSVDYFSDCAETHPYFTKFFTNQIAISADRFSDAGDSGSLIVDTATAEPVGLFFAGGTDAAGVGQGVASPAPEVLAELSAAAGNGTSFTFVGGTDHAVSCLSYGDSTIHAAQESPLSDSEIARAQQALFAARSLVNPTAGILGIAMGKSSDHPGEAAVVVYVTDKGRAKVPSTIEDVRTVVILSTPEAVALGSAPLDNSAADRSLAPGGFSLALGVKLHEAANLMRRDSAFFGVGVGQSLDDPRDAALVIYVDRNRLPAHLPAEIDGVRTRYIVMDRLHVTRSYAAGPVSAHHCLQPAEPSEPADLLPLSTLNLF